MLIVLSSLVNSKKYNKPHLLQCNIAFNYANGKPINAETLISDNRRKTQISIVFPWISQRKEYTRDYVLEMRSFSL